MHRNAHQTKTSSTHPHRFRYAHTHTHSPILSDFLHLGDQMLHTNNPNLLLLASVAASPQQQQQQQQQHVSMDTSSSSSHSSSSLEMSDSKSAMSDEPVTPHAQTVTSHMILLHVECVINITESKRAARPEVHTDRLLLLPSNDATLFFAASREKEGIRAHVVGKNNFIAHILVRIRASAWADGYLLPRIVEQFKPDQVLPIWAKWIIDHMRQTQQPQQPQQQQQQHPIDVPMQTHHSSAAFSRNTQPLGLVARPAIVLTDRHTRFQHVPSHAQPLVPRHPAFPTFLTTSAFPTTREDASAAIKRKHTEMMISRQTTGDDKRMRATQ